jgi:hypothetical protein
MHDPEPADVCRASHSAFVLRQLSVAVVRAPLTWMYRPSGGGHTVERRDLMGA